VSDISEREKKIVFLSYSIDESIPLYGSTPQPQIRSHTSISEGASSNSAIVTLHDHTGTHIDFPRHFIADGKTLSDYRAEDFVFERPLVAEITTAAGGLVDTEQLKPFASELSRADLLLVKTGFYQYRGQDIYRTQNPGIHYEAIKFIRQNFQNIRALGTDSISISSYQHREDGRTAHREALCHDDSYGRPLLLIESMDLSAELAGLKKVVALPLYVKELDAAPCTIVGELLIEG